LGPRKAGAQIVLDGERHGIHQCQVTGGGLNIPKGGVADQKAYQNPKDYEPVAGHGFEAFLKKKPAMFVAVF
jgi:hypothetical protein